VSLTGATTSNMRNHRIYFASHSGTRIFEFLPVKQAVAGRATERWVVGTTVLYQIKEEVD
jgi:hypothetical protein